MPVPTLVAAVMDSLKSAELIRELKAETEKLVETSRYRNVASSFVSSSLSPSSSPMSSSFSSSI